VDIGALRRYRRQTGMPNQVARQRFELYAPMYAGHSFVLPDQARNPITSRAELIAIQERTIARLIEQDIIR
jgi:hypothetical protein